jgi:hypothetical protein
MNGVDSTPALPNPRFRKKWRRDSDMESSFYTLNEGSVLRLGPASAPKNP